jgi:hypothetical protein
MILKASERALFLYAKEGQGMLSSLLNDISKRYKDPGDWRHALVRMRKPTTGFLLVPIVAIYPIYSTIWRNYCRACFCALMR